MLLFRPGALLAFFTTLTFAALAQQPAPTEDRPASKTADNVAAESAPPSAPAAPAEPAVAPAPSTPSAPAPQAEVNSPEPPLRRLDEPAAASTPDPDRTVSVSAGVERDDQGGTKGVVTVEEKAPDGSTRRKRSYEMRRHQGGGDFPMGDHYIAKGSKVRDAVSVLGSTTVDGEVNGDAVSVIGSTTVGPDGNVTGAAVAVLGPLDVRGKVGNEAVSVLGGVKIDGEVRGEVVSVLGDMWLGPNAVVNGDVVLVLGKLTKEPGAVIRGNVVNTPGFGSLGSIEWLTTWFKRCVLLGRPLAFGAHLGWAWLVALSFLVLYLIMALLFPRGVEQCAETLETRPGYTIVASMLTVLLTPVVIVLLLFTIVGALLVPFLLVALMFAGLFGKAVMLAWLGRRVARVFNSSAMAHAAVAVLVGGVIVLALYVVPILGFLVFKLLGWLGLGVVVYTIALRMKRERPPAAPTAPVVSPLPIVPPPPPASPAAAMAAATEPAPGFSGNPAPVGAAGFAAAAMPPLGGAVPMMATSPAGAMPAASAIALPRASLMIRLGALLLDVILVAVIAGFLSGLLPRALRFGGGPPGMLPLLAIYGAIMWKLKGTTIGGIVCGLKVVRLDGRELDWPTAIVRALGCFLSLIVVGLGFIWIAIDDEKQSWHDKIAGTIVVRLPKSMSLL